MRGLVLAVVPLLAAGCDRGPGGNEPVTAEQIERISTPTNTVEDVSRSAHLEPLSGDEIAGAGREGGCVFARGADILLVSAGSNAVARVDGAPHFLVPAAPPGPTGAFFEDRQVSISIGRSGEEGDGARITATNRRTEISEQYDGTWTCEGLNR